ncbi:PHP domain-containing protein [Methylonatrum kenyense]|uniref:PHP domain-containing protein n=1 Tax=Methylonatrum kenyense TaxID=455253 RepID=UPI0024A77C09|nr:PHP domain-containing protein [Methylonatrum kenyense]
MQGPHSKIDLHCHSRASDGQLTPAEVVARAAANGVRVLALTDHDTLAGVAEAAAEADRRGMHLVPAVECSCAWQGRELHIVGLGVNPAAAGLQAQLWQARDARWRRMRRIADKLEARRINEVFDKVCAAVGDGMPTRAHVARVLHAAGHVQSVQQAFDRYLGRGKPAWTRVEWPTMEDCVAAIRDAGGQAVLAHPLAYGMTGAWLRRTLAAFRDAGGEAVEVVCGSSDKQAVLTATGQALRAGLKGSVGSDFHSPENPWIELGRLRSLPPAVPPVWQDWPLPLE